MHMKDGSSKVEEVKPLLKIRQLPGDKLSGPAKVENFKAAETKLTAAILNPLVSKVQVEVPSVVTPPVVESTIVEPPVVAPHVVLRPFLKPQVAKIQIVKPSILKPPVAKPQVEKPPVLKSPVAKPLIVKPPVVTPQVESPNLIPITISTQHYGQNNIIAELLVSNTSNVVQSGNAIAVLNPILEVQPTKSQLACSKMLSNKNCLAALYKCMASTCSFFTCDKQLFNQHLARHATSQPEDRRNFMMCPYCNREFEKDPLNFLAEHIESVHGSDCFQCSYCFFRAFNDFHVFVQHQDSFHKVLPRSVIECEPALPHQAATEMTKIRRSIPNFVPLLTCPCKYFHQSRSNISLTFFPSPACKASFYVFKHFTDHMEKHNSQFITTCTKCKTKIGNKSLVDHFCSCHGFGLFQCVYCRFGANSFAVIDDHLVKCHSSRSAVFCERSLPSIKSAKKVN